MQTHPEARSLREFALGRGSAAEARQVVRHLLAGCADCTGEISGAAAPQAASTPVADLARQAFSDHANRIEAEQAGAQALLHELDGLPLERRRVLVRNSRRFQNWGFCDLLLESAYELRFDDPQKALDLVGLGVDVAFGLDAETYGSELVADFRARALAYRANALRIASDHGGAEASLAEAKALLEEGTKDPLEEARVIRFEAGLRSAQGDFQQAIRLQRRAIRYYRSAADTDQVKQTTLSLAGYLSHDQQLRKAIGLLRSLDGRLDWQTEPRMVLACRHNLIVALVEDGSLREADHLLQKTRPLYAELGDSLSLLRLRWLEGQLAVKLGRRDDAEKALRSACRGFLDRSLPFESALVCLELTALYLEDGRLSEAEVLALQVCRLFEALSSHRRALAAFVAFRCAVESKAVTASFLEELASYLGRARQDPSAKFRRNDS